MQSVWGGPRMPLSEMSVQCIMGRLVWVDRFFEEEHIRNCGHRRNRREIEAGFKHHQEVVKLIYEAQGGAYFVVYGTGPTLRCF